MMSRFTLPFQHQPPSSHQQPPPPPPPSSLRQQPRYSGPYPPPPQQQGRHMPPQPQQHYHTNQRFLQQSRRGGNGDTTDFSNTQPPQSDWDYNTNLVPQMYHVTHPIIPQQPPMHTHHHPSYPTHHHPSISNTHSTVDEPIIELSERQQQILRQRRQHQQALMMTGTVPVTEKPFQTRSNVPTGAMASTPPPPPGATTTTTTMRAAATVPYYEPWDKPFVTQQQQPQQQPQQSRPKTLLQSVMQHPAQRHHPSPTSLKQMSNEKRAIDPPATKNQNTTGSSTAEPLEEQKKILRGILIQKHSPRIISAKRGSTTMSGTSHSSNHSTARRSPQTMLQRVLQTASSKAAISPKQQPSSSLSRPKLALSKKQISTKIDTVGVVTMPGSMPPPVTKSSPPSLRELLRPRFAKKQLHHPSMVVDTNPAEPDKSEMTAMKVPTTSEGYESFVQSLMNEVSSHHSELYASFVVAMDATCTQTRDETLDQIKRLSPKSRGDLIVDANVIKQLNSYLQQQPMSRTMVRPATQLMNDKQYSKLKKKRQFSMTQQQALQLPTVEPHINMQLFPDTTTVETYPKVSTNQHIINTVVQQQELVKPKPQQKIVQERDDEVLNSRSMDSSNNRSSLNQPATSLDDNTKKKSQSFLSVEIPPSHSSDSTTGTNDTSPTTSSTTMAETLGSTMSRVNENGYGNRAVLPRHATSTEPTTSWNRIQLRNVHSNDSQDDPSMTKMTTSQPVAPEWATITLRPVSCRSDTASSSTTDSKSMFPQKGYKSDTYEKLTMDEIMETENVTMIRLKEEVINCCDDNGLGATGIESRVVIGETLIRHIQYDAVDMTAPVTVLWTLPRHEMEPDGITINMSTFKITLLLRNHRLARKVLSFETSEDCLRFATAFYNMPVFPSKSEIATKNQNHLSSATIPPTVPVPVENQHSENLIVVEEPNVSVELKKTEQTLNHEEQVVLEKYRELRLTKQATDALIEAIALQQTKHTDMAIKATNGALPSNVDAAVGSLPNSPVSTFTATTAGVGDHTQATSSSEQLPGPQWTDDDKKVIEKYRLMIQRGVPVDAVRHKMTLEQVEERFFNAIFTNDDNVSTTVDVIRNDKNKKMEESSLSIEENVIAEKYRKMLKLRIPIDAVQHKMLQDQVEAKIVAAVLGHEFVSKQEVSQPSKSTESANRNNTALSEEEESVAVQYRKLLKINVSKDALLSRMKQEGVSPKIIIAILGQNALQMSSSDDGAKGGGSSGSTGSKMISINWDHTENAIAGSVWEVWQNAEPEPMDFSQLKQMFQRKEQKQKDMKNVDLTNGIGKAKLLDLTRSNNIAISLKAFKEFSNYELAEIIRFLDPIRKIRGERTNFIRDLLPTLTEVKIIDEYNGPDDRLVPAELWFRHLRGIQRIERKARVIRTMEMFTADTVEVRDNFRLLADVCRQVMASTKLQDVLGMVLRIGNVMNEGTRNGRAAGFKFNSLLRLTQTKTADGKITVLDYLVSVFVEKGETDTLDLISDFPDCHKASRFLISDMSNEVKSLKENLEQCKLELADLELEQNPPPQLKQQAKLDDNGTMTNPHSLLFASILARAGGCTTTDDSLPTTRKSTESFTKRDEFLAAIKSKKIENAESDTAVKDPSGVDDEKNDNELTSVNFENTLAGGIMRLRKFIEVVEGLFARLEKTRNDALAACKDLSRYCGESGGVGVTISLLDVLSQFTKNLEDALKKYQEQQLNDARKLRLQEAKEVNSIKSSDSVESSSKKDGKSIVVTINNILRNANSNFKEGFKKGWVVENPSESLKIVYEHEKKRSTSATLRLDIVSAIQQREEKVNDEEIAKARSTFAGVQALLDESSPRELTIDQISSYPFSSSDSHSECTMSNDGGSTTMDPMDGFPSLQRESLLDTVAHATSSNENALNLALKDTDNGDTKVSGFNFDIRSSQDRLRSRRSLSPSKVNIGSLADVMKNLEEIKKQSPSKKIQPPRLQNDTPPLAHPRSVERKSISERAREKRSEKRPNTNNSLLFPVAMTSAIAEKTEQSSTTSLQDRSPTIMMLNRQRRLTSMDDVDNVSSDDKDDTISELPIKDSSFARLARQKRIQKRMTK